VETTAFRNTELAYNDELARWAEKFGFKAILAEGWDKVLEWRSSNNLYRPIGCSKIGLLLKNYRLSDDIAFRFSNKSWSEYPLTVPKYMDWMSSDLNRGSLINLFMDFETFGEHQWADTGIFKFFEEFVETWTKSGNNFLTVSEAASEYEVAGEISMPEIVTWADTERDLTAWTGNKMQRESKEIAYSLKEAVFASRDKKLIEDWRRLLTSDHAYYMCTKYFSDGDVHAYFSPYSSPYDAFIYYMNVLRDLKIRIKKG
jgi:alpha-amylase